MTVFVTFLFIGIISNEFTCSHDILKIQLYKQNLYFNIKLNYNFKTLKNQANVTFAMGRVIVIAPIIS